jgi:hypothetical protein
MKIHELFALREEMAAVLKDKLIAKRKIAEDRLRQIKRWSLDGEKS